MATDVSRENEKDGMIMKNYSEDVDSIIFKWQKMKWAVM